MDEFKIAFRGDSIKLVDKLQHSTNASSRAEVIRMALYALDLINSAIEDGNQVSITDSSGILVTTLTIE